LIFDQNRPNGLEEELNSFPDNQIQFVRGDLLAEKLVVRTVTEFHPEVILHLATLLTPECEAFPVQAIDVNIKGAVIIFAAAAKYKIRKVLFGSSVAVFDNHGVQPQGDLRTHAPTSLYGHTKSAVEQIAGYFRKSYPATDYLGLRFGWVYGPGRDRGWREVQEMIESFARRQPVVRYPDYQEAMDWTYIEDAVQAVLITIISKKSTRIALNVSGDYRRIQDAIAFLEKRFPEVKTEPYPAELPPVGWQFEADGIVSEFGYQPKYSLEDGLSQFLHVLEQGKKNEVRLSGN
jgi:UDP-glucose 4-epimerase